MNKEKIKEHSKNFGLLLITIILFLLFFELTLRIFPGLLGKEIQNEFLQKYRYQEDGIYLYDPLTGTHLMKPNQEVTAYYNEYYWEHKTDSRGFRNNKEYETADILLLGDSIIYGSGVNQNQTLGFFLEESSDYSVYNLAVVGYCPLNHKYVLTRYGKELKPKYVFLFFFSNDVSDVGRYLTEKEMNYFIFEQDLNDYSIQREQIKKTDDFKQFLIERQAYGIFIERALATLILKTSTEPIPTKNESNSLEWQYTEKAIKQMKYFSDSINAEFIIVPLTNVKQQQEKLKEISEENNIPLIDTEKMIAYKYIYYNPIKEEFALPGDGHLNEKGHKKLAEIVLKYLKEKEGN